MASRHPSRLQHFIALAVVYLVLAAATVALAQTAISSTTAVISDDGTVSVTIVLSLGEGFHEVRPPIEPVVLSISATGDGEELPVIFDEGYLYLYTPEDMVVEVGYLANVSVVGGLFTLGIETNDTVKLMVPKNIILLSWPDENVIDIGYEQGYFVLLVRGPTTISYTIKTATTVSTPPQSTTAPTSPATPPAPWQADPWLLLVLVAGVIAVATVAYFMLFSRKRGREEDSIASVLGDVDIAIIKALEARGGEALQSELQNDVGVPRTTLWRHVKKLEKLGIVRIEKLGMQNKIVLVKKVKL